MSRDPNILVFDGENSSATQLDEVGVTLLGTMVLDVRCDKMRALAFSLQRKSDEDRLRVWKSSILFGVVFVFNNPKPELVRSIPASSCSRCI